MCRSEFIDVSSTTFYARQKQNDLEKVYKFGPYWSSHVQQSCCSSVAIYAYFWCATFSYKNIILSHNKLTSKIWYNRLIQQRRGPIYADHVKYENLQNSKIEYILLNVNCIYNERRKESSRERSKCDYCSQFWWKHWQIVPERMNQQEQKWERLPIQ